MLYKGKSKALLVYVAESETMNDFRRENLNFLDSYFIIKRCVILHFAFSAVKTIF